MFRRKEFDGVYLSYFDDSGSEPSSELCVFGGVVVDADQIHFLEYQVGGMVWNLGLSVDTFREFKAGELYFANGQFSGFDLNKCRSAFKTLVDVLALHNIAFVYCAVNTSTLAQQPLFGSAKPVDVAFQMCLDRLEQWAWSRSRVTNLTPEIPMVSPNDMCLVIADECDKELRRQLGLTFRKKRRRYAHYQPNNLLHIHDSMYFGDSIDSIGLQMADVACWTMRRILGGAEVDPAIKDTLLKVAVCADVEPQWSANRNLFKSHDDV